MAYIGKSIESGTFSVLDTSGNTYNGSNTTFNLGTQVGSVAQLLVSHDGVIQKPGTDYTLASGGSQITFTTAPASGASIFIVEISGAVGGPLDSDLNGAELILDADGDTSITADTDDQIDIKIAGADDFKFSANAMNVLSGSTLTIDSGATITNSGTASGFGVALDDVSTGDAASTLATSAGNITVDAQGNDTDIIFKGTDGGADTTFLTIDGSAAGASAFNSYITSTAIYGKDDGNTGIQFDGSDVLSMHTGGNERARYLSDGRVCWGVTSQQQDGRFTMQGTFSTNRGLVLKTTENGGSAIYFDNNGTGAGYIQINTNNTVSYNTSSDYRLKENVNYDFDATSRLKQLKPARFNWIADETDTTVDGFLAHEVSNIVPESIDGVKDATETLTNVVVSSNGNQLATNVKESEWVDGKAATPPLYPSDSTWQASKEVVLPQSIDQAKLVPLLTKALQEAITKIESLEARVTTLEG